MIWILWKKIEYLLYDKVCVKQRRDFNNYNGKYVDNTCCSDHKSLILFFFSFLNVQLNLQFWFRFAFKKNNKKGGGRILWTEVDCVFSSFQNRNNIHSSCLNWFLFLYCFSILFFSSRFWNSIIFISFIFNFSLFRSHKTKYNFTLHSKLYVNIDHSRHKKKVIQEVEVRFLFGAALQFGFSFLNYFHVFFCFFHFFNTRIFHIDYRFIVLRHQISNYNLSK